MLGLNHSFRFARRILSFILPLFLKNVIKSVCSFIILNIFLTYLLMFAIVNNIVLHIAKKNRNYYFRDTRSSLTKILPKKFRSIIKKHTSNLFLVKNTSSKDLNIKIINEIDNDIANNIVYDHYVTDVDKIEYEKDDDCIGEIENEENPFKNSFENLTKHDKFLISDLNYYFQKYNIDIETIEIETDDGFIIELWHLIPNSNSNIKTHGHPVLLLHGLLQSSGSFASSGKKSLAYFLCTSGYDVWLGNNRCGFEPKYNHSKLKKDDVWDWDVKEMIKYDLRAMIEKILVDTDYQKLTLVGHSQGTAISIYGLINGEDIFEDGFRLIDKIENFVALAPAVYPGPLLEDKLFIRLLRDYINNDICFGTKSFLPIMMFVRNYFEKRVFAYLCYTMFNYLFDWNDKLWNNNIRNRHFMFSPVYVSVKLMKWWLSPDENDHSFIRNSDIMFPDSKVWFPIKDDVKKSNRKILETHTNAPKGSLNDLPNLLFFVLKQDRLVDGERLINHLINYEDHNLFKIWYIEEYSHMDVLWANDIIERVGRPLINNLREPKQNMHNLIESVSISNFISKAEDNAETEYEAIDSDSELISTEEIISVPSPEFISKLTNSTISNLRSGNSIDGDKSETEIEETENETEIQNTIKNKKLTVIESNI
ncbi:hypothetical protein TPHA_0E03090 [Tetrapisispora phaffii CBS 4417]|uniref:Partial AB-hydrolase lipase domain-containing protein n=1 Tax=Tetrapisispora phaffii (strain ATCC 24235 / CBS 4417 / NBRC 1672 / NRRL Y-8282 / UCD 70-5) TaxID=1071381 RepID=G8BU21_TETPH|nr:hypothetical protein TPHA_0E03090 [Tetrapisispora phaffii CBS 4417]CCE63399.1 hypothetical protein TPHA_0E03090 [Tetrapisispora phaffii CBS 4417]